MRDYADIVSQARIAAIGVKKPSNRLTLMQDAADAIEELLAAVPHWISVEDEPPKEDGRYFVRYKCDVDLGDGETVHEDEIRVMRFFVGEGWRYPIICNDHVRLVNEEVTHWMPLPKAPKEAE